MSSPIVLSIGTTHPWNVAGVGRDLVVGTEIGARVFTAVAAVTAQDAAGVHALAAIDAAVLEAQLDVLPWQSAGAVRVGALATAGNVRTVARALRAHPEVPAIVDPVFETSRGGSLADAGARAAIRDELATLASVILTPNLAEAAAMLECEEPGAEGLAETAMLLRKLGCAAVLLKGGHLAGEPTDAFADASGVELLSAPRIAAEMRGTGCTLAMALACEIARGSEAADAVRSARAFVRAKLSQR